MPVILSAILLVGAATVIICGVVGFVADLIAAFLDKALPARAA